MTQSNNKPDSQGEANNAHSESAPTVYRSRVRSLLGVPSTRDAVVTRQSAPPVGFEYPSFPVSGPAFARETQPDTFSIETGLPSLEDQTTHEADDARQTQSENVSRSIEITQDETGQSSAREQHESHEVSPPTVGGDMTPNFAQRRGEGLENRDVSREQDQSGEFIESVQDEISVEQLFQEHSGVQQFSMDIPGFSEGPVSFPALSGAPEDSPDLESESHQTPRIDTPRSDARADGSETDAHAEEQTPMPPRAESTRHAKPRQPSEIRIVEESVMSSQSSVGDSGEGRNLEDSRSEVRPPAPTNQQADSTARAEPESTQAANPSPVSPAPDRGTPRNIDSGVSVNVSRDVSRYPEPVNQRAPDRDESGDVSGFPYLDAESVNRSYRETLNQLEQIRNSMRQLAARDSSQTRNDSQESRHDEPLRQPLPPPPPVVVVQRTASRPRAPRAFWERRYLGHFRLRTLR